MTHPRTRRFPPCRFRAGVLLCLLSPGLRHSFVSCRRAGHRLAGLGIGRYRARLSECCPACKVLLPGISGCSLVRRGAAARRYRLASPYLPHTCRGRPEAGSGDRNHVQAQLRLRDYRRRLRGVRARAAPHRGHWGARPPRRSGGTGALVGVAHPDAGRALVSAGRHDLQLGVRHRSGAGDGRAANGLPTGEGARRLVLDQRHGLHPRKPARLRRMGAGPGPRALVVLALPAVFQAGGDP